MDKASDYESGDSRFESWRGRFFPLVKLHAPRLLKSFIVKARSLFSVLIFFISINWVKKKVFHFGFEQLLSVKEKVPFLLWSIHIKSVCSNALSIGPRGIWLRIRGFQVRILAGSIFFPLLNALRLLKSFIVKARSLFSTALSERASPFFYTDRFTINNC